MYKISSRYLQKWLSYDIKHVENNQICPFSLFLFFSRFLIFQKVFLGHFSCSLRKVDLKTCIPVPYHKFFVRGWPFLPDDLRWPWPVLCSSWMLKTAWDGPENLHTKFQPIHITELSIIAIYTQIASGHILLAVGILRFFQKLKRLRHSFSHVQ